MKIADIKIGEWYQVKDTFHPTYAKPIKILKPKEAENTNPYTVVKCLFSTDMDMLSRFGVIKYFKPTVLIKDPQQ